MIQYMPKWLSWFGKYTHPIIFYLFYIFVEKVKKQLHVICFVHLYSTTQHTITMSKRTVRRPDFMKGLLLTPKNSFWRLWLLFFLQKPFPFYHQMSDTWHICAKKGQKHFFPLKNSTLACAYSSLVNHLRTLFFRTVLFKFETFCLHFDIWLKPKEVGTPYCFCRVFFQKLSLHCSSINLNGYSLFFSVSYFASFLSVLFFGGSYLFSKKIMALKRSSS